MTYYEICKLLEMDPCLITFKKWTKWAHNWFKFNQGQLLPPPRLPNGWLAFMVNKNVIPILRLCWWSMDRRWWMALYQSLQSLQRNVPSHFHRESPGSLETGARGCSWNEYPEDVPLKMSANMLWNGKLLAGTGTPALRSSHPKERKSFSIGWS